MSGVGSGYQIKVISVYATQWSHGGQVSELRKDFDLGMMQEFYTLVQDQMPRVLRRTTLPPTQIAGITDDVEIVGLEVWLFALPSDQVVAALAIDIGNCPDLFVDERPLVSVLTACAYNHLVLAGGPLTQYVDQLASELGAELITHGVPAGAGTWLPPERHQIVLAPAYPGRTSPDVNDEVVSRILFRIDPPYRREFFGMKKPKGLNQETKTMGMVTPYVSLLYAHEPYVENSVFLTAVQAVGTAARFRQIWHEAYSHVSKFRRTKLVDEVGRQRREDLEELVDQLGNLELDLSFSVETAADLGLLIPSLRIGSYHRDLYEVMELPTRAATVSQMFTRLDSSIQSEITAIEIRDQKYALRSRTIWAVGAAILSFIGVLATMVLAFFGVNATEVDPTVSMFDRRYLPEYIAAALLALLPALIIAIALSVSRLHRIRTRPTSRRRRAASAQTPATPRPPRQRTSEHDRQDLANPVTRSDR